VIALLVMTDGRDDLLDRALAVDWRTVDGLERVTERWIHDDTGSDEHRRELAARYPEFVQLGAGPRRGFGGAIRQSWSRLRECSSARYVLHLEDDFVLTRPLDLAAMVKVMDRHPYLTQMALRRQPWNEDERRAGGIVERQPDDYTEVRDGDHIWLEHRRFWTTNPSIYRRSLCEREWPVGLESEGRFGLALWASDPSYRAAFWGSRDSGERCEHIGRERVGSGY
jgi:hypothetical protein